MDHVNMETSVTMPMEMMTSDLMEAMVVVMTETEVVVDIKICNRNSHQCQNPKECKWEGKDLTWVK